MENETPPRKREQTDQSDKQQTRRAYLVGLGVTSLGLSGYRSPKSNKERLESDFTIKRTFNVVKDLGVDPSGTDPVGPVIRKHLQSNTRLVFPPGNYLVQSSLSNFGEGLHDFSMVAPSGEATFIFDAPGRYWLSLGGKSASNLHYERFTHDVADTDPAPRLQIRAKDGLFVRHVTHTGLHTGDTGPFQFGVEDPKGRGVIEDLRATTGAPDDALAVGMFVGKRHTGRLEITDCSIHGFPNNGIYQADGSSGRLIVSGGTYKNNNISNVRIAGPNSIVRNVTIVITGEHAKNDQLGTNVRGIRITNGTEMTIENCDLSVGSGVPSDGAIVVENLTGTVSVQNTRISLVGNDIVGIRAKRPKETNVDEPSVTCTNVQITGSGINLAANGDDRAGIEIVGRPRSHVKRACVKLTRRGRVGVILKDCKQSAVVRSSFSVTGESIVVIDSDNVILRGNEMNVESCAQTDAGDLTTTAPSNATENMSTTEAAGLLTEQTMGGDLVRNTITRTGVMTERATIDATESTKKP